MSVSELPETDTVRKCHRLCPHMERFCLATKHDPKAAGEIEGEQRCQPSQPRSCGSVDPASSFAWQFVMSRRILSISSAFEAAPRDPALPQRSMKNRARKKACSNLYFVHQSERQPLMRRQRNTRSEILRSDSSTDNARRTRHCRVRLASIEPCSPYAVNRSFCYCLHRECGKFCRLDDA
jgi:hypothetical protein